MNLDGITVLDLTRLLPGPYATQLLADDGADVIKLEEPELGDYARYMEPQVDGTGAIFSAVNRGKRSLTLDLTQDEGRDIFFRLVREVDVVIEGFSAGKVDEMGIGFESAKDHNEDIIYCSLSGYGQTGPYSDRAGHDLNYSGITGLLDMTRRSTEDPPPVTGFPISDMSGGLMAAYRIVGALLSRELDNDYEQYLDVSMAEATLSFSQPVICEAFAGNNPRPGETILTGKYPCYNVYESGDGKYVTLGALEPKFWENFCKAIDRPDLIEQHLSNDPEIRESLFDTLREIFSSKSRDDWIQQLADQDTMVAPVLEPREVVEDTHLKNRGVLLENEFRISLHKENEDIRNWPDKGEHSEEILREMNFTDEQIDDYLSEGVL